MPNLIGTQLETATGIVASQGLVLARIQEAPSEETVGLVLVQFPEEGSSVASGDSVHLIVASPPLPDSGE
jgi:beta-lactam-binding protein with PASTA domain